MLISTIYGVVSAFLFLKLKKYINSAVFKNEKQRNDNKKLRALDLVSKIFSSKINLLVILYFLTYKLGEMGAMSLLPLYLIESGISRQTVTFITSTICGPLSLVGSLMGGILWSLVKGSTSKLLKVLGLASILRVIPLVVQVFLFALPGMQDYAFILSCTSMTMLWFLGGLVSAFAFTLMTMVSCIPGKNSYATYYYAVFSSVEVCGKLLFSSQAGYLSDYLGKQNTFAVFSICIFVNVAVLYLLRPHLLREFENDLNKKSA